jgi:hypothetical protein
MVVNIVPLVLLVGEMTDLLFGPIKVKTEDIGVANVARKVT